MRSIIRLIKIVLHKVPFASLFLFCFIYKTCAYYYNKSAQNGLVYFARELRSNKYDDYIRSLEKYILNQIETHDIKKETFPEEIDIVLSSGGFKNCYSLGVLLVLKYLNATRSIKRYSGASAGGQLAYLSMTNQHNLAIIGSIAACKTLQTYKYIRPAILFDYFYDHAIVKVKNIHETYCIPKPNKLYLSMTEIRLSQTGIFHNLSISDYASMKELRHALAATAAIPLFMCSNYINFRNKIILDGAITNHIPIFKNKDRLHKQLVINLTALDNKYNKLFYFKENEIKALIKKGIDDTFLLLRNNPIQSKSIYWIEPEASK